MARDSGKDRSDHKSDREGRESRDRPERSSASQRESGSRRDREGSSSSLRDRDREFRDQRDVRDRDRPSAREESSFKRLRNEGEPRQGSSSSNASISSSKSSTESSTIVKTSSRATVSSSAKVQPSTSSTVRSSTTVEKTENVSVLLGKKEIYDKIVEHESREAKQLKTSDGMTKCQSLWSDLEMNLHQIMAMKSSAPEDAKEIESKMGEGLMKVMDLRRLNRIMKLKLKSVKEDLLEIRSEVDADHLLLQNLLYEATHLHKQVAAVQDYKGIDEQIDLIPVEKFFEEAPETISKPEITKSDPHLLRIARLEYEFVQRQKLTEDCNSLEKEKERTSSIIDEKQAKLDSIKPMLSNVLEATKPIQDFFGLNISGKKIRNEASKYLPAELYILFVQSNAFKEAGSEGKKDQFFVNLCGDLDEAKELVITPDDVEEDSDSEKEQDPDNEISERRLQRKKSSIHLTPEETKKKLIQKHPLWVQWIVRGKGEDSVVIQFFYLIKLKIVTVKAKVVSSLDIPPDFVSEQVGTSDNLLIDLFPDDSGLESPNPANMYLFQKVDCKGMCDFINETGRPFMWSQRLAGIEFPLFSATRDTDRYENFVVLPKMSVSALSIETILRTIRKRLTNQTTLWNQLKFLDVKNIQIPAAAKELFPAKSSTYFKSWEFISFSQYLSYSFTKDHLRTESVSAKNMFYKATLERGRAIVTALVSLSLDFPMVPPVFCVQLELDGNRRHAGNDTAIRDLEKEVNIYSLTEFEEWAEILVNLQIQRLIQCIDIILETDFVLGESAGPSEFAREKLFLRAATGRNSRRPFKYFGTGAYFSPRY